MPNLIGLTEDEARLAIGDAGLTVGERRLRPQRDRRQGRRHRAGPQPRPVRRPGHRRSTSSSRPASRGRRAVRRRPVQGRRPRNQLRNAKLEVAFKDEESDEPKGEVVAHRAGGGETVTQGTRSPSSSPTARSRCPNVIGLQQGEAEEKIRDAGFEPQVRDDNDLHRAGGHGHRPVPGRRHAGAGLDGHHLRLGLRRADAAAEPDADTPSETPTPTDQPTDRPRPGERRRLARAAVGRRSGRAGRRRPAR